MRSQELFAARPGLRRHAVVWLALAAALAATPASAESRVVDVRVGLHADHTRVVIELDGQGSHRISKGAKGEEIAVALEAGGARRRVVSKSPLVSAVVVEPAADGSVARIVLREPGLEFSELRLQSPPRIVIDVRRPAVAARKPTLAPAPPVAASDAEEVAEAPSPDEPTAKKAAVPVPERDPFAPPAGYEALVAAQRSAGGGLAPVAPAEPGAKAGAEAAAPAPRPATPPSPVAATTPPKPAPRPAAAPPPVSAAGPSEPAPSGPGQPLSGRLASVDPTPFLFLLVALVGAWFAYRRFAAARTRRGALEESEPVEIFGDAARSEPPEIVTEEPLATAPAGPLFAWEARRDEVAEPPSAEAEEEPALAREAEAVLAPEIVLPPIPMEVAVEIPAEEPPRPAPVALALVPPPVEEEAPEPEPEASPEPAMTPGWQTLAVPASQAAAPEAAAPEETALAAALAGRIAQLEARIEELRDARERLERFAAAQNEELRVQRAAIARTQRVIRGLSKPEDDPAPPPTE